MLTITKRLEFDSGHRIPGHKSQCRNLHGHRYALEITLQGEPVDDPSSSDHGMLMDFGDVKTLAKEHLVDLWDHAFLVHDGDTLVRELLERIPGHKTVVLDRVPTAENLVAIAFGILDPLYARHFGPGLVLHRLRLYETPTSWADCDRRPVVGTSHGTGTGFASG